MLGALYGNVLFALGVFFVAPGLTWLAYRLSVARGNKKPLVLSAAGGAFAAFLGVPVTIMQLVRAFKSVGDASPEEKSRLLSEGIGAAITYGGLLVVVGLLLAILSIGAATKFERRTAPKVA